VIHIIRSLAGAGLLDPASARPARLELDTSAFFEATGRGPTKLGLGSSAALTVALASAVVRWSGRQDVLSPTNEWLTRLATIHREFQGGRGSGVDLAASLLGGALEYRVGEDGDPEMARPLRLPEGLHMLAVWTGRSADTGSFLRRLAERSAVDPNGIGRSMDRLAATSGRGLQALSSSRVGDFLDEVRRFCSDMEELGRRADMPILSAEHDRLVALTRPLGVAYKPSGAGGGDLGVCFSDSADALDAAASEVRSAGFEPIDLTIDQVGLA
jgi:phosphomevalonate kinase